MSLWCFVLDEVMRTSAWNSPPVRNAWQKRSPKARLNASVSPARSSWSALGVAANSRPNRSALLTVHDAMTYVEEALTAFFSAKLNFAPPLNRR